MQNYLQNIVDTKALNDGLFENFLTKSSFQKFKKKKFPFENELYIMRQQEE